MPSNLFRHVVKLVHNTPRLLAVVPALILGGYWLGGEGALVGMSLALVAIMLFVGGGDSGAARATRSVAHDATGPRDGVQRALDQSLRTRAQDGRMTACLLVQLDEFTSLQDRLGHQASEAVLNQAGERLRGVLRDLDIVVRLDNAVFAVALTPARRADLESLIQLSGRLQSAIAEPVSLDATTVYVSASVGFCLTSRTPKRTGEAMLEAAEQALKEARLNGPGAIRSYSAEMQNKATARSALIEEVGAALENGQIRPWFQPQISTDTGHISGFEALSRWTHPQQGLIPPADFLPAIEQAGLSERLGEVVLYHAFTALNTWQKAGFDVPMVGVNFSGDELRNPKLVDKIRWELDRFNLEPGRLAVEILETVVAGPGDDTVTRNIAGLSKLGCHIDLDDFGTGHASIANIRRFAVSRIKIDRSFVSKVDDDSEQQRMISAILTMAERLELDTLAEGVETIGEHAMLAQLGCGHIQGFGLARPMPFADTLDWMRKHIGKISDTPKIGRQTG